MSDLFRRFFNPRTDKLQYIKYNTIGSHKDLYFDYIASGLAFRQIENRLFDVLKTYANTHSKEASMASKTNDYYNEAYDNLHKCLDLNDDFIILPCAFGATWAIKKFQELLGLYIPPHTLKRLNIKIDKKKLPLVIIGPYEHHSNEVSYREALCELQRVSLNDEGLLDLLHLENILKENQNREIIGSFSVASNVTGIITPYKKISQLLRKYNALVCFDAAACSSYMNIDCSYYDAMVTSAHKLLGGPGSCGLLIIKKDLIDTSLPPTFAGGGTVTYVSQSSQRYNDDPVIRETAGTPGILQFIKASLSYCLRNEIGFEFIAKRKNENMTYFIKELNKIPNCTIYGNQNSKNIGIVSFNIGDDDPYILCDSISKNSGIQTRAGCSCAGPYGHDLLDLEDGVDMSDKPGWLRISIHFSQTKDDIDKLLNSIKKSIIKK